MLNKHLIVKTYPKAHEENIVPFGPYRITVLGSCLFRIEKDEKRNFNDDATQSIWYRNMPKQKFTVKKHYDNVEITTDRVTLFVSDSFDESYAIINGKNVPLSNDGNLLGTTRTLDCYDGEVCIRDKSTLKLDVGVCSESGVAVIDDTNSLRLLDDGKLTKCADMEFDIYVFAFGHEYREAVRALYSITGYTPMLPRYSFGNWWSRYHSYTDEEYLYLLDEFEKKNIPLTVATIDMDWHYSNDLDKQKKITESGKISEHHGTVADRAFKLGWTGYSWNTELFPDYRAFLREIKKRDLKITLNLHPADGVRYFEDMYEEMAVAMGVDPKSEKQIKFDIANDDFVNNYFKILHNPYEKDGVDFWWIDWQQGTNSAMEGLDPLWALNHYHSLDIARDGDHPLIMSRYAGIGSHRYPIGFSGDTSISWATLSYMPYFTATATNSGYTWWGHDIGGHHKGTKDDELYIRFLQFGVFNPMNRMHCTDSPYLTKEPWTYENGIGELAREMLIFRHRMIPFLYTCNYRTHKDGLGLVEPMYYAYSECPESYKAKGQYLFGSDFIVAPIVKKSEEKNLSSIDVWLPEGRWTDIFTGVLYTSGKGGKWVTMVRPLDYIPVLAREGAVLPLSSDKGNSSANPENLELQIFNGNGSYTLYEDDGKCQREAFTRVGVNENGNTVSVKLSSYGDFSPLPASRNVTFNFRNIVVNHVADPHIGVARKVSITVLKDGKPTAYKASKYAEVSVTLCNIDYSSEYEIQVICTPIDEISEAKRAAHTMLQRTQQPHEVRGKIEKFIFDSRVASKETLKNNVYISEIERLEKIRMTEMF